jgi:hypothetical protein
LSQRPITGPGLVKSTRQRLQGELIRFARELERGISVLKARGVRHETEVRRMSFTESGIEVGSAFKGLRGVLTGLPLPVGTKEQ